MGKFLLRYQWTVSITFQKSMGTYDVITKKSQETFGCGNVHYFDGTDGYTGL